MKKLFAPWRRVPRPARIGCNLLLLAVLLAAVYLFRGCPPLTIERAYRRAAAENLVDGGELLGIIQGERYPVGGGATRHYRLAVAENDVGVMLYSVREDGIGPLANGSLTDSFSYRDKTGTVTLLTTSFPGYLFSSERYAEIPVILFDKVPKAVRAELDLYIDIGVWGYDEVYEYHLNARREHSGFFEFRVIAGDALEQQSIGNEAYALNTLHWMLDDYRSGSVTSPVAAVRLYDGEDRLIYEEEMIIGSEQEGFGDEN